MSFPAEYVTDNVTEKVGEKVGEKLTDNQIYNTAVGDRTTLNDLVKYLKENLSAYDPEIAHIEAIHGPNRVGDIPHSLASVEKAKNLMGYKPSHKIAEGLKEATGWYWENLR